MANNSYGVNPTTIIYAVTTTKIENVRCVFLLFQVRREMTIGMLYCKKQEIWNTVSPQMMIFLIIVNCELPIVNCKLTRAIEAS